MWRRKVLNIIDNVDTLVFNKWANTELLLDLFRLYYTNRKQFIEKYKDMFRQRREQMIQTVLNRVRKRFFNNWEIDFINEIVNKQKIIDKETILQEVKNKFKYLSKLDLQILFDAYRNYKWVISWKYKAKTKNNYIIFQNNDLKKYFDILYKTIINKRKKENKDKLSIESIKKALSRKVWEEISDLIVSKFCEYINFYCNEKVVFTKSTINTVDKVKNFIAQIVGEWKNSFLFREIKQQINNTNPNNIVRALNILKKQGYVKRIDKWLYKVL